MSKVRYELGRVSEEAKNAYLQHAIDESHPHNCGPRLMRIFKEAAVPEALTAKEVVEKVMEWSSARCMQYGDHRSLLVLLNGLNVE